MTNSIAQTQTIQAIKPSKVLSAITVAHSAKLHATASLAYHSLIHGNVCLGNAGKEIAAMLDSKVKRFVCASFDSKLGQWKFNKTKAEKLQRELGLTFQKSSYEDFLKAIQQLDAVKPAKKLETTEQREKRVLKYMQTQLEQGMTVEMLETLLIKAKLEQAKH